MLAKTLSPAVSTALLLAPVVGFAAPAAAYIDGGSGSLLLQLLLGGVAGLGVIVRLYWSRVTERFGRRPAPAALPAPESESTSS